MIITCKICNKPFEWVRGERGGRQRTICLSAECRKERNHQSYIKFKAKHSEKGKQHNKTQYKRRKYKGLLVYEPFCKDIPKSKQWPCKRCGKMSDNYFNCPTCRQVLSDRIAGDEYIFDFGCGDLEYQFSEAAE